MKYLVAKFKLTPDSESARDLLAAMAGDAGFESFEEVAEGLLGYVQEQLLDKHLLDESIAAFPVSGTTIEYTLTEAEDKDWNQQWEQAGFDPIVINEPSLAVIYDANRPLPDLSAIESQHTAKYGNPKNARPLFVAIDAHMAFGTGTHETTQMVVAAMLRHNLHDKRVLDCGCGTGILSIVAAKMGAKSVVAYDIDEWSVKNTHHNAAINQIESIEALLGNVHVLSHVSGLFDVVVANINRNILLSDMHAFKDAMASGALLIISGFYETDVPLLVSKATELGLEYKDKDTLNQWCCLTFG